MSKQIFLLIALRIQYGVARFKIVFQFFQFISLIPERLFLFFYLLLKFSDFFKVGLPLNLSVGVLSALLIPWFWPL